MLVSKSKCEEFSDQEIIRKSLEEVDYFSCLYQRYQAQLLRYISRLVHASPDEAEDLLQESFIQVWKHLRDYDSSLRLSSWIYRIVHNQAISWARKQKSFGKNRQLDWKEAVIAELAEQPAADQEALSEQDRLLRELIHQLPAPFREVVLLKYFENMSYAEISDVLKIPEGTVATRINRAKKALTGLAAGQHLVFEL